MSVNKSKLAKSIMDRGQWSPQPNELWSMPISVKAKSAYCYLLAQQDNWNPGLKGIATGISMSINSARAAIKELEDANMISVEQSPNGLRNVYTFTGVDEWNCQAASNSAQATHADSAPVPYHPLHAPNTNTTLTTNTNSRVVSSEIFKFKEVKDSFDLLLEKELSRV